MKRRRRPVTTSGLGWREGGDKCSGILLISRKDLPLVDRSSIFLQEKIFFLPFQLSHGLPRVSPLPGGPPPARRRPPPVGARPRRGQGGLRELLPIRRVPKVSEEGGRAELAPTRLEPAGGGGLRGLQEQAGEGHRAKARYTYRKNISMI